MATLPGQRELVEIRGNYLAEGELKVGYSHRFASHRIASTQFGFLQGHFGFRLWNFAEDLDC